MFLEIDGVVMPAPIKYDVSIMHLSKAERNALGTMIIERIGTKRKIELDLKMLSPAEISLVLNAVDPVLFEVKYQDPKENSIKTGIFYSGDKKVTGLKYSQGRMYWKGLTFNIVER